MNNIAKVVIAAVIAVIAAANMSAQGEQPLVREGVKWLYENRYPATVPPEQQAVERYYMYFDGTITIDNIEYYKCYRRNLSKGADSKLIAYLRQENGKVYRRLENVIQTYPEVEEQYRNLVQSKECLIYDFSLNAGSSWKLLSELPDYNSLSRCANLQKVDSVGYVQINDKSVKIQHIHSFSWAYGGKTTVIEGIGCLYDEGFPTPYVPEQIPIGYGGFGSSIHRLVALEDSEGNVIYDPSGVGSVVNEQAGLSVAGNRITVKVEGNWSLTIFRVDGSKAGSYNGSGPQSVTLPFAKGLYIALLADNHSSRKLKFLL